MINLTLIGEIITFLVFWWFIYKFIWPAFAQIAEERQKKIAEGLGMAESARFKIQDAQQAADDIETDARKQASEILSAAQKQAAVIVSSAQEEALKESELIRNQAQSQIENERKQAYQVLKKELSSLVIEGVSKIVKREVKEEDHKALLAELNEKF